MTKTFTFSNIFVLALFFCFSFRGEILLIINLILWKWWWDFYQIIQTSQNSSPPSSWGPGTPVWWRKDRPPSTAHLRWAPRTRSGTWLSFSLSSWVCAAMITETDRLRRPCQFEHKWRIYALIDWRGSLWEGVYTSYRDPTIHIEHPGSL